MPNITLSVEDEFLRTGRQYAQDHGGTLNGLVRRLLAQAVLNGYTHWIDECLEIMDRAQTHTRGRTWSREAPYDV